VDAVSEAEVGEAVASGRVLDCADGRDPRTLDADVLRRFCLTRKAEVDPRGIRIANAAVTGQLDLTGLDVSFPLRLANCVFGEPVVAEGAQLFDLVITGSNVPGLVANGVRVRRDLDLSRSSVAGAHRTTASHTRRSAIWLCESEIGGRLICAGTRIDGSGGRAIQADRMRTGGAVQFLDGFTARGEVRLIGVELGGSLDLTGPQVRAEDGVALDLSDATIRGSLFLIPSPSGRRPVIEGCLDMSGARVAGQFLMRDATLTAPPGAPSKSGYSRSRDSGIALSAQRLTVASELTMEGSCEVLGGMDLSMSTLGSLHIDSGCALRAPGKTAVSLANAEVRSAVTLGEQVPVQGTLRLTAAEIHGDLRLRGVRLSDPEGMELIAAEGTRVDGVAELVDVTAEGGVLRFRAAVLSDGINVHAARLHNPAAYSLDLTNATVRGIVGLTDCESSGKVVLNRTTVDGRLLCEGGVFDCPSPTKFNRRGHAIEAISANIGGMDLGWRQVAPSVDFTDTRTSFLADDPARWPARFTLAGFSYERLEQPQGLPPKPTWDHAARCAWLGRQVPYNAGPYEQAARVFRQHGYGDGARAILIAQRRHARTAATGRGSLGGRALDAAYGLTVAYGYRPARVLWLILALLVAVTVSLQVPSARAAMRAATASGAVYTTAGPLDRLPGARTAPCGDGEVRCFNPVLYAIDTVVPIISLDQRSTWYPDTSAPGGTAMQWWLDIATILGWLLSSVFVLALTGLARSP
jgi:hypothetical protein